MSNLAQSLFDKWFKYGNEIDYNHSPLLCGVTVGKKLGLDIWNFGWKANLHQICLSIYLIHTKPNLLTHTNYAANSNSYNSPGFSLIMRQDLWESLLINKILISNIIYILKTKYLTSFLNI